MSRVWGLLAVVGLGLVCSAGSQADDRDEFYAIARGDYGRQHRQAAPAWSWGGWGQRPQAAPQVTAPPPRQHEASRRQRPATPVAVDNGSRAFCVRTCDGFFFPVGPVQSGEGQRAQEAACTAMCPGAPVRLYTARRGTIEEARSAGGESYSALQTAFRFRERVDASCSCQGSLTRGLANLSLERDHTLRSGDIVVMAEGVRIFREGGRFPYRAQDFVAARNYGRLAADIRRRVDQIEASRAPVIVVASSQSPAPRATPRETRSRDAQGRLGPIREMMAQHRSEVRTIPIHRTR